MGLVRLIAGLPLLPVRGVIGLAELVRDQTDRELHDPTAVRRRLEEIAEARDAGSLSDEEAAQMEHQAFRNLIWQEDT